MLKRGIFKNMTLGYICIFGCFKAVQFYLSSFFYYSIYSYQKVECLPVPIRNNTELAVSHQNSTKRLAIEKSENVQQHFDREFR